MYYNMWTWLLSEGLAWQTFLRKTRVRSKLLTNVINCWKRMLSVKDVNGASVALLTQKEYGFAVHIL